MTAVNVLPDGNDAALAADGDAEAFERLYRENSPRIYSLARRMAGEDSAEDLTQEVFLRAWQKLSTFRRESSFSTWLHRLAVNLILTRREQMRKREARFGGREGLLDRMFGPPRSPGLKVDLEAAIQTLPQGAKQVFVLYDVEGHTHEEISGLMSISIGTSKSQLHRARSLLRTQLT